MRSKAADRKGFTLIEVIVVMAVISTLVGIMIPFIYRIWESNEIDTTRERMADLKKALVGDPKLIQNGVRTNYGYVGESGQLPDTITTALLNYMPAGFDPDKFNKDAWGSTFVYSPSRDAGGRNVSATLSSMGPDRLPGTSDDIADSELQISVREVTPTDAIQGNLLFVFSNATAGPLIPDYTAMVTAAFASTTATSGCISLNIGQINAGEAKPVTQSFSNTLSAKLPVGRSVFKSTLYTTNNCSGSGIQSANEMAVFIPDGLNVLSVNLPTINYTIP